MVIFGLGFEAYYNSPESQPLKTNVRILNSNFLRKTISLKLSISKSINLVI